MTWEQIAAQAFEAYGLPGAVIAVGAWGVMRFGLRQTAAPITNETAFAIERLSGKIDAMRNEMTDRLARVETDISNIHRGQK